MTDQLMNKLVIPSILAATVLIAGMFAFMPVERASTVHTGLEARIDAVEDAVKGEIRKNRFFLETVNLGGVTDGSTIVVADSTPHGMGQVHIASTLPVADTGADGCTDEEPLVDVLAGQAGEALIKVLGAEENTGINGRVNIGTPFGSTDDMCVFHTTIDLAIVNELIRESNAGTPDEDDLETVTKLTDIVVVGDVGALPADAFITVSGTGMLDDGMGLSGRIKIGGIFPLTGDLSDLGKENRIATELGVADFNDHLAGLGEPWSIELVSEDSETSPAITLEKIRVLNAKGINIIIGPETSANVREVKDYADSNNMLLVSCCSTAPSLAIAGDSVYRLIPDDNNQGPALAKLLDHEGIEVMIPVYRNDVWGRGLSESTINSFEGRVGQVGEGIPYDPESPGFSAKTSLLAQEVQGHVDDRGPEKVAVLFLGFGEIVEFMKSASGHDVLDDVRWFGPAANAKERGLVDDPIGLEDIFATNVRFTTTLVAVSNSERYHRVNDHVSEAVDGIPSTYVHPSYDAPWIVGLAMLETQSTDVDMIKRILPRIAENFDGATGGMEGIILNDAGDRGQADYDIWGIRNGEWVLLGKYTQSNDSVVLTGS